MSDTRPDLAAIKARAEAATAGEWFRYFSGATMAHHIRTPDELVAKQVAQFVRESDGEHIAGMDPPTTLALVAYAERCEAETARLREHIVAIDQALRQAIVLAERSDRPHVLTDVVRTLERLTRAALTPDAES